MKKIQGEDDRGAPDFRGQRKLSIWPFLGVLTVTLAAAIAPGCAVGAPEEEEPIASVEAYLTLAERMARYEKIRDAAAARGITSTAYLLAGIAHAETGLAHCWSEATWACQGPYSPDCNGPVIAGAGDGPCSLQQGGLGMFQFDAGTFTDTLNKYGNDVLTIAGNTSHAINYVINMVKVSAYTTNAETDAKALQWINNFDFGNGTLRDQWIKTVTRYYNGCQPGWFCWSDRYNHYNNSLQTVVNETGLDFWIANTCKPEPEVCNGKDDDCDNEVDEDDVCEKEALLLGQSWVAPARTTDIDGDGLMDVCGRGMAGVWCHLSQATSWGENGPVLELSDKSGWDDPTNWGTMRWGDIDGDGRADLCARANANVDCWKSDGTKLATHVVGPGWSDDSGWNDFKYHSTIRLLDIDGDGKDDLCARAAKGVVCYRSTGNGFDTAVDGPAWSNEAGYGEPKFYGTLRTGDVNGDGREDLCIRSKDGMECWLSNGSGFPTRVQGPNWSDEWGWSAYRYWSTIRLVDVNGDWKADLCARAVAGLRCHLSQGDSFGEAIEVASLSDDSGWNDPSNFLTLRTGDIDGNGTQDLCVRANAKIHCYLWNGNGFDAIEGPDWSDADGWNEKKYYHSIQLADMNGDGRADLCGRHVTGWRCHPSTGNGFGDAIELDEFTDAGGWGVSKYFATVLIGGTGCVPSDEVCNGKDDDCDGLVDEDGVCDETGGTGGATGSTGGAGGSQNLGAGGTMAGGSAGKGNDVDTVSHGDWYSSNSDEGCTCRLAPKTQGNHAMVGWFLLALTLWYRSRRR
ncbi:MAG TPA: VCBS repeat-containing protein [Polyangiaceae bacterium]|nr:VCBS repeat-containing protein [Polyangiaceae bacterium]